jgi:hypothetical protein
MDRRQKRIRFGPLANFVVNWPANYSVTLVSEVNFSTNYLLNFARLCLSEGLIYLVSDFEAKTSQYIRGPVV